MNNVHRLDTVSKDIRKLLYQQETLPNGEQTVYTLGCLFVSNLDGHREFSHSGAIYGFTSHEAYYPEDDVVVIVLTNGEQGPASLTQKISREVLGIKAPVYASEPIVESEISRLVGSYHFTAQTFVDYENAKIAFNGGMLMLSIGNSKDSMFTLPFTYSGSGLYIMAADDEITLQIESAVESPKVVLNYHSVNLNLEKLKN